MLKADACAQSLNDKNPRKFWSDLYKINNSKASADASMVGGACGTKNITKLWKDNFEKLYNTQVNSGHRLNVMHKLSELNSLLSIPNLFNVNDVIEAVQHQKCNKAAGLIAFLWNLFVMVVSGYLFISVFCSIYVLNLVMYLMYFLQVSLFRLLSVNQVTFLI